MPILFTSVDSQKLPDSLFLVVGPNYIPGSGQMESRVEDIHLKNKWTGQNSVSSNLTRNIE